MASFKFSPSSSSSIPNGGWKYDVFLSFRGKDTRYNFVDHLYAALVQRGIHVFKDDEMLHRGEAISLEIMKVIEQSKFAVVVFSKNYANSSWCLVELAKIMECRNCLGQKVLPVFYHVDPSDVRAQTKDFGIAFEQCEQKFKEEKDKVNTWREALTATAGLSGLHISNNIKEGESTFINKIVQAILGDIQTCDPQNNLVGIESRVDAFQSLLDIEAKDEVRMVGIYGMGGIGKTTLAQALFRRISHNFAGSSFVKDVRENSYSKRDICALQEKVLREILMTNHKFNIQDPEDGANMIRTRFIHKNILLVLDDVDNGKQLEFLAATHHWFGPGSRIIITTRNEQLLSDTNARYKPSFLSKEDALELFSRHAFKKNNPPEGYEELSFRAISYAGYLPLGVKVLGSFFRGRKAGVWESAFNRLAKTPNDEIFETLKLSFDALEDSEKNIFLDIACFFKGKNAGHVTRVLDSCGFDPLIGISVLVEKSLITISNKGLEMHDLIQEMGWKVVRQSFPNSRLWRLDEIQDFIRRTKKLKAVEAIVVQDKQNNADQFEEAKFSTDIFVTMKNLRLLDVKGKFTFCEPTFLPDELRWLCWNEYPFSSLPIGNLRKLAGIEVAKGSIKQFWKGQKIMPNLKFIKLQQLDCLTRFPDVSGAPNIERLILLDCKNLVEVHESLGSHKKLVKLDMIGCERLRYLPSRIEMESLKVLRLSKCYTLERFPDVSPCMVKLDCINLDCCFHIEELPSSFGYLSGLTYLNLKTCANFENLQSTICESKCFKNLVLQNCKKQQKFQEDHRSIEILEMLTEATKSLPKSISVRTLANLYCLKTLDLSLRQIQEDDFPKDLHAFSALEKLNISGNNKLIRLPTSISHLSRLRCLKLDECRRLESLHTLPSRIQALEANNCSLLKKIEDLSKEYGWLYEISFINCYLLEDIDNKRYLDNLLQESFLKRCAAVDRQLRMAFPGNKIPSWFKEEHPGCKFELRIPLKSNTEIIGYAICGLFPGEWQEKHYYPCITTTFKKDGKSIRTKEIDCVDASVASENGNIWISYRTFSSFRGLNGFQCQNWFGGSLVITLALKGGAKAIRCATRLMYKEDVESIP